MPQVEFNRQTVHILVERATAKMTAVEQSTISNEQYKRKKHEGIVSDLLYDLLDCAIDEMLKRRHNAS